MEKKMSASESRACIPTLLRTVRSLPPPPASLPASGFTETQNGHLVCCAQTHRVLRASYILHNIMVPQTFDIGNGPTKIFSKKKKKANFAKIPRSR